MLGFFGPPMVLVIVVRVWLDVVDVPRLAGLGEAAQRPRSMANSIIAATMTADLCMAVSQLSVGVGLDNSKFSNTGKLS